MSRQRVYYLAKCLPVHLTLISAAVSVTRFPSFEDHAISFLTRFSDGSCFELQE